MGTWGTEVQQNTSVTQIGGYSMEFIAGQVGEMVTDYYPVQVGAPYRAFAHLRGTSVSANNTCKADIDWYTAAKGYISSTNIHATAALTAADTWEEKAVVVQAPATAAFARVLVEKVAETDSAWTLYCDGAGINPFPYSFFARRTSNQSINGSTDAIVFDDETSPMFDYGAVHDTATGIFTAPVTDLYAVSAGVWFEDLNAGVYFGINIICSTAAKILYGSRGFAHANGDDPIANVSYPTFLLAAGETLTVVPIHNHGANRNILGAANKNYSWFTVVQLRK